MLQDIDIRNILFLDIETVPQYSEYTVMPEKLQKLWDKKSTYFRSEDETAEDVFNRGGIYAEFGKIICISVGIVHNKEKDRYGIRLKSYAGDDEKNLLSDFGEMIEKYSRGRDIFLCAHNGKEFDFPYIARRMLIQGLPLPHILDNAGKKPWEVRHLDTMELWKFGDYKHYTSLELLTAIFDIPSPKNDMDGSMVADVYYREKDLQRITEYCQNDVLAMAQLMMRYKLIPLIDPQDIEFAQPDK